jgi:ankyrin repeat protein
MNRNSLRLNPLLIVSGLLLFSAVPAVSVAQSNARPPAHELSDAVLQGDVEKTKKLIKLGADVQVLDDRTNPNGRYPLNWAAWQNNVEIINALLDAGADINKANLTGFTPLHHAIESGSKEAAALLIKRGANLNTVNRSGMTPLQFAEAAGRQEIEAMLKEAAKK